MSGVLNAVFVDRCYYLPKDAFSVVITGQFLDVEDVDWRASIGTGLAQGGDVKRVAFEPLLLSLKLEGMYGVDEFLMVAVGKIPRKEIGLEFVRLLG